MKTKVLAGLMLSASVLLTETAPAMAAGFEGYLIAARDDRQYRDERRDLRSERDYRRRDEERDGRFEGYGRGYEEREQEKERKDRQERQNKEGYRP